MATNDKPTLESLQRQCKLLNLIGLAMIGSVFLYAVVVEVMGRQFAPFTGFVNLSPETYSLAKYVLLGLALVHYFILKLLERVALRSLNNLVPPYTVIFALAESVAVIGLALFLIGGRQLDFYLFMGLAMIYFYLFFPRFTNLVTYLEGTPDSQ